MVEKVV